MTKLINMNFFIELANTNSVLGISYNAGFARNTETDTWHNSHILILGFGFFHMGVIWLTKEIDKPDLDE